MSVSVSVHICTNEVTGSGSQVADFMAAMGGFMEHTDLPELNMDTKTSLKWGGVLPACLLRKIERQRGRGWEVEDERQRMSRGSEAEDGRQRMRGSG